VGSLLDWNFRREARIQGLAIETNRQQGIENFNIERSLLMITLPMFYFGAVCILAYGWVMQFQTTLAGPLVMLFFTGLSTTGAFNTLNSLVVDANYQSAATAVAANNLCRCLMRAARTAFVVPTAYRCHWPWVDGNIDCRPLGYLQSAFVDCLFSRSYLASKCF
jgi:hypothetical protein